MSTQNGRRRVLIVTSSYNPTMIADMQRARMLCWDLPALGWDARVLTAGVDLQRNDCVEPESLPLFNPETCVHEAASHNSSLFTIFKMRSIGWRAFWPMYQLGCQTLGSCKFDVVYITTTQFALFCLGRLWRNKFGVPYVLDFHDPWFRETNTYITTRHSWKLRISSLLSRYMERYALKRATGLVAVSPTYLEQLEKRYPDFHCVREKYRAVIPFGATPKDFAAVGCSIPKETVKEEKLEVVYIGAGGSIMAKSFRRIIQALVRLRDTMPELTERIRLRFCGTESDWRPGDRKFFEDIAREAGARDLVEEHPERVTYLHAMEMIANAHGVVILGVDDPAYMPSKLFTYALTGKPLLACLHYASQANRYFREMPTLGRLIHFDSERIAQESEDGEMEAFLKEMANGQRFARAETIAPYLSPAVAQKHANLFETCLQAV